MPRKASPRASQALSPETTVRDKDYSQGHWDEWDLQRKRIINKHNTRKLRAMKKMEKEAAFQKKTPRKQSAECASLAEVMKHAMEKELEEGYEEWMKRTIGIGLNASPDEEHSDEEHSDEEHSDDGDYEEFHGFDSSLATASPSRGKEEDVEILASALHQIWTAYEQRFQKRLEEILAPALHQIWKSYEKRLQKRLEHYLQVSAIEEDEDEKE
jgi:hypothetical protein